MQNYSNIFKSKEEIQQELKDIENILFNYELNDTETFASQIEEIQTSEIETIREITKALKQTRELYNLAELFGHTQITQTLNPEQVTKLFRTAQDRLTTLNAQKALEEGEEGTNILHVLEDVIFFFQKVGEHELKIADELNQQMRNTREEFQKNFDQKDTEYITLYEELERVFKKKKLNEITQEDMQENIQILRRIQEQMRQLNRRNNLLKDKYKQDPKYTRIHKRIQENPQKPSASEIQINKALLGIKEETDQKMLQNDELLQNEAYFEKMLKKLTIENFKKKEKINLDLQATKNIGNLIAQEYLNEFNQTF